MTRGRVVLRVEVFYDALGLRKSTRSIRMRPRRCYDDTNHVISAVILLNILGLENCDDLEHLRDDIVLGDLCRMKARYDTKSRMESVFPSPPALRKWLYEVGGSAESLLFVMELMHQPLQYIQERKPQDSATLYMNTTFIHRPRQGGAPFNYKGERSNEALNVYWAKQDMILHSKYVADNVSPRSDQLGLSRRSLKHFPPGVKRAKLRPDNAEYDTRLIRYCNNGESPKES